MGLASIYGSGCGYGCGYGDGYGDGCGLSESVEISEESMTIGFQSHSLDYWLEHGKKIAKDNGFIKTAVALLSHHLRELCQSQKN